MLIFAVLIFTATLAPTLAQNNVSGLQALIAQLAAQLAALQNAAIQIQRTVPQASVAQNDGNQQVIADYVISSGTQCGPRTITGWTKNIDFWYEDTTPGLSATVLFGTS